MKSANENSSFSQDCENLEQGCLLAMEKLKELSNGDFYGYGEKLAKIYEQLICLYIEAEEYDNEEIEDYLMIKVFSYDCYEFGIR